MRERTGKDNKREKVELIASEMEINQIILYANFVYHRKVKCENCLNVWDTSIYILDIIFTICKINL